MLIKLVTNKRSSLFCLTVFDAEKGFTRLLPCGLFHKHFTCVTWLLKNKLHQGILKVEVSLYH
jgi:hypothetical protein